MVFGFAEAPEKIRQSFGRSGGKKGGDRFVYVYHLPLGDRKVGGTRKDPIVRLLPLSGLAILESTRLGADFHKDPADQLIVATARIHALRLLTADERIKQSGVVFVP